MNFKVKDTAWFIGVGCAILAYLLGLFSGFALSNQNVFVGNIMLMVTAASTLLVGIGLLIAATEVFVKKGTYPDNHVVRFGRKVYQVVTGQTDETSPSDTDEVEEPKRSINEVTFEADERYLSPQEIVAASYVIQKYFSSKLSIPDVPANKPIVHEEADESEEEISSDEASMEAVDVVVSEDTTDADVIDESKVETNVFEDEEVKAEINDSSDTVTTGSIVIINDEVLHHHSSDNSEKDEESNISSSNESETSLYGIILVGDEGINPFSDDFKDLLTNALREFDINEDFRLRLTGKTYGLGARGVKETSDGISFTSYTKNDVTKMLKKTSLFVSSS